MKFIDETVITVEAGHGGNGCLSFRREKFVPKGGPDGGDGGDGGSIYLEGTSDLTTLVSFQYQRSFKADSGQAGMGGHRTGKSGDDLIIRVPNGTLVYDHETHTLIGDITQGERLLVAQGGFHGLGNARFKSSVNRAPRQTSRGSLGETRSLRLELRLLADVGLLGLPNAGKSTLIRAISSAKPKVADYPFTTLEPNLGVVRIEADRSFVVADIPGLIEGASQGSGLGHQFLKHLSRTAILLHLVDLFPIDETDPVHNARIIQQELASYNPDLLTKPCWLILNKADLALDEQDLKTRTASITEALGFKGPVFTISGLTREGTQALSYALMNAIEAQHH